jgi:hypothetical protein
MIILAVAEYHCQEKTSKSSKFHLSDWSLKIIH